MANIVDNDPYLISIRETGRLLNDGRSRVYELIKSGELRAVKDGRRNKVVFASVRERLERLQAQS
jgi:excisionase family DNA binding protein